MPVIFLIGVAALIAAAVRGAMSWERRIDKSWQQAADRLGLRYRPGSRSWIGLGSEQSGRRLSGTLGNVDVSVTVFRRGSGQDSNRYTRYRVGYPPLGIGLEVMRANIMRRVLRALGSQDIEVGDAEFDEAAIIRGDDPNQVEFFMSPARRIALHRLITDHRSARIDDDEIEVTTRGVERNPAVLVSMVRRLTSVAGTLTGGLRGLRATDAALEEQRRGDLGKAARLLRSVVTETPDDPETRRLEGEALYASKDYASASQVFGELRQQLPADPWASEWARMAEHRAAHPDPPAAPAPTVAAQIRASDAADALFDPSKLSFETTALFEERYEGKRVRWSGELQRHSAYRSDLDFPNGPGVKAVFEVHRLRDDLFGGRDVDAVVQLPPEAAERLDAGRGERFTFEGTLVKLDALMRNLFLVDGKLVE